MDKDWMTEEYGIPHKNGHVRFYMIGFNEDVHGYLGWFDMTDWDKGWDELWETAKQSRNGGEEFSILRHDQLLDLQRNVINALEEALEDKDETTFYWWYKKEAKSESKGVNDENL